MVPALIERETPGYQALRVGRWSGTGCVYHLRTSLKRGPAPLLVGAVAEQVTTCLLSWQETRRGLLVAFVVMPDHLHVLAAILGGVNLQQSFGRWKRWCSKEVNRSLGRQGSVWQPGFFDRRIRKEDDIGAVGRYIEHNPVRRSLVDTAEAFPYSSADPAFASRMLGRQWLVSGAVG